MYIWYLPFPDVLGGSITTESRLYDAMTDFTFPSECHWLVPGTYSDEPEDEDKGGRYTPYCSKGLAGVK